MITHLLACVLSVDGFPAPSDMLSIVKRHLHVLHDDDDNQLEDLIAQSLSDDRQCAYRDP